MTRTIWLASYPKSGNTWFRLLLANLSAEIPIHINDLPARGLASARGPFDYLSLIDSGLLTPDEIDRLRPHVHEEIARGALDEEHFGGGIVPPVRFIKVHDAYTIGPDGAALLAGRKGADGAIVIVRDPRDIVSSLANHNRSGIDEAIAFMNDRGACWCQTKDRQDRQFRQNFLDWSGHVKSWLEQRDIPVHLVRYEDLQIDGLATLRRALDFAGLPASDSAIKHALEFSDFNELARQEKENGFREASRLGTKFFRQGQAGAWRTELDQKQVARIEAIHAAMMRQLGYGLSDGEKRVRAG